MMYFSGKVIILLLLLILFISILSAQGGSATQNLDDESETRMKKTLPDFRFIAVGDFGCNGETNRTVTNMITKIPTLVLALGDLSYQSEADCWFNLVSPLERSNSTLRIVIGSHDDGEERYQRYLEHFKMDKPYYSFDYQNVHLLGMATGNELHIPYNNTSDQYQFVKKDLKDAHSNPDIDWIIVYGFRPLYSSLTAHPGNGALRDLYHPLFEKYDVDLVLQAHNHNYQRTYPVVYNEQSPSKPIITDKNKESYSNPEGDIFITAGTAGASLHNFTGHSPFVVRQFESHGFLNIDITNNGRKLTSTFYENRELDVKDRFTIIKNGKN